MRQIILIRHSTPTVRPELPSETWQLSDEGRERAESLGDALASRQIAAIWSSTEPKAIETAEAIGAKTGLLVDRDARFNEQHRANAPFLGASNFRTAISQALRRPDELLFGQETVRSAITRFREGIEMVDALAGDGAIAVVSHGTVLAGFTASLLETDPVPIWQSLGLPGYMVINWPDPDQIESHENFDQ